MAVGWNYNCLVCKKSSHEIPPRQDGGSCEGDMQLLGGNRNICWKCIPRFIEAQEKYNRILCACSYKMRARAEVRTTCPQQIQIKIEFDGTESVPSQVMGINTCLLRKDGRVNFEDECRKKYMAREGIPCEERRVFCGEPISLDSWNHDKDYYFDSRKTLGDFFQEKFPEAYEKWVLSL